MIGRCLIPDHLDAMSLLAVVPECTLSHGGPLVVPMFLMGLVFFLRLARGGAPDPCEVPAELARRDGTHRR